MHFLKKLMIGASFISATFAADGIILDRLPAAQEMLAQLQGRPEFTSVVSLFTEACAAVDRSSLAERIERDPTGFLLSSGVNPLLVSALANIDNMPFCAEEKERFRSRLIKNSLEGYSKYFEAFVSDVRQHSEPFISPLLGVFALIAGRGQTFTGCGASDVAVSEEARAALFDIFECTGVLTPEYLVKLRAPQGIASDVHAFMSANPNVDTLVIAGSHVGLTKLPYDPHRGALVVNLDPERGADVVAPIAEVLPRLPDGKFVCIIDDSNFGGGLLKEVASDLFRVMQVGGKIEGGAQAAYAELTAAGFEGVFTEVVDPERADPRIKSIGDHHIRQLDLSGLRQFLGEANYSKLMDEVFVANLFSSEDTIFPLTEETKGIYFLALRVVYEQVSDISSLLVNVQGEAVDYEAAGVFKVKNGKIHLLDHFVKP